MQDRSFRCPIRLSACASSSDGGGDASAERAFVDCGEELGQDVRARGCDEEACSGPSGDGGGRRLRRWGGSRDERGRPTAEVLVGLFQQPVDLPQCVDFRLPADLCRHHALWNARWGLWLRDSRRAGEPERRQGQLRDLQEQQRDSLVGSGRPTRSARRSSASK
jgi:hypothetical protein